MDGIDVKIIKMLQKNARITASEIGSEIKMSVPSVSERLKKLEASGIIEQYTAIVNPKSLKKDLTALMFVSLERPKFNDKFVEFVQAQAEILECHYLAGDFDYVLKILTEGTGTMEALLNRIKSVPGIQKTRTIVVLSTMKNRYSVTPDEIDS